MCALETVSRMSREIEAAERREEESGAGLSSSDVAKMLEDLTSGSMDARADMELLHSYLERATQLPATERRAALDTLARSLPAGQRLELP